MRLATLPLILIAIATIGCSTPAPPTEQVLVLSGMTVVDGTGAPARHDLSIVIREGRIAAVLEAGERLPAAAHVQDLGGRYLMPGLIDGHVHLATQARPEGMIEQVLAATLLGGVTTVRDMGGAGASLEQLARAERAGAVSPRIVYAQLLTGPGSTFWQSGATASHVSGGGPPGSTFGFRQITTIEDAERAIAEAVRHGAAGVKLHSGFDTALATTVVDIARRRGLQVWAHASLGDVGLTDLLRLAPDTVSHADMLAYAGVTDVSALAGTGYLARTSAAMALTPADGPALGDALDLMRTQGVALDPTLMVMGDAPETLAYRTWVAAATQRAHARGVRIVAGTDALGGSSPNLHLELQLLVERGGLSPVEAIRAATLNAAVAIGRDADLGSIAPGKRADLVVLSADPSLDIRNTLTVTAVIKDGRVHRRDRPMPTPPGARTPGG